MTSRLNSTDINQWHVKKSGISINFANEFAKIKPKTHCFNFANEFAKIKPKTHCFKDLKVEYLESCVMKCSQSISSGTRCWSVILSCFKLFIQLAIQLQSNQIFTIFNNKQRTMFWTSNLLNHTKVHFVIW